MARAAPDGGTLLFTSSSVAILPALNPNLGFDPVRDLLPISVVCDLPPVLLVRADSRFANLRELVAEARSAPGRLNYGSGGVGSANHLAGASFASMAGIDMVHIPYAGTAQPSTPRRPDRFIFAPTLDVLGHVRGQAAGVGVGAERVPALRMLAITEWFPVGRAQLVRHLWRAAGQRARAWCRRWHAARGARAAGAPDAGAALIRLDGRLGQTDDRGGAAMDTAHRTARHQAAVTSG